MRMLLMVILGMLAHLLVSALVFMTAFSASMQRIDTGAPASGTERVLDALSSVLLSPVFFGAAQLLPQERHVGGVESYALLVANSLLWSLAGYFLYRVARRQLKLSGRRPHPS